MIPEIPQNARPRPTNPRRGGPSAVTNVSRSQSTEILRQGMQLLADGMTASAVAERLGVSYRTARRWRDRPSAARSPRTTYCGRCRLTSVECESLRKCISTTGPYSYGIRNHREWTAAAIKKLLLRQYPDAAEGHMSMQTLVFDFGVSSH